MSRVSAVLLLLFATTTFAQTADLTLSLKAAPTFNAGELATITAIVTNNGPDAATAAGVRLKKVSTQFTQPQRFGCIDLPDSVLCTVPTLAAGASHEFTVPFVPPDQPGPLTLSARTDSVSRDPNSDNDSAAADTMVVDLADLGTTIETDPSLQPGKESRITVAVTEQAARVVLDARLSVTIPAPLEILEASPNCHRVEGNAGSWTCTVRELARGFTDFAIFRVLTPVGASGPVTIAASATSSSAEWNDADNTVTSAEPVFALPDLTATISAPEALDDRNRATVHVTIANPTDIPAPSLVADILQAGNGTIVSWNAPGWSCRQTAATSISCSMASLAPRATSAMDVEIEYAAHEIRSGLTVRTTQTPVVNFRSIPQSFPQDTVYYRTFEVTTTADGGPGSLRQAIAGSNDQCSASSAPPCRIIFHIAAPVPHDGWFTIEPPSPFPAITSTDFAIDGETQTALTGDTNPLGPEVFLLGDAAGRTDGLRLSTKTAVVRGLAIGGFGEDGIQFVLPRPIVYTIERNYLGVDPTGRVAVPNGLRGIQALGFQGTIENNVISGNRRSGAFLVNCGKTVVTGNRVGVAAASDDPLPNGAAGVFFHETFQASFDDAVRVQGNVIAFNTEDGISTSKDSSISLLDNVVAHNGTQIDMDLDGPTPGETVTVAAPPLVTSARIDSGAGDTVVEGSVPMHPAFPSTSTIYLYANTSAAQGGEEFIGTAVADATGHFSLRVHRDLRGRYIDGTTFLTIDFGDSLRRNSSEFGQPVRVTE